MQTFNIKVTETYVYYIDIKANNEKEALRKARTAYKGNETEVDGVFVADATTIEDTKFKVTR